MSRTSIASPRHLVTENSYHAATTSPSTAAGNDVIPAASITGIRRRTRKLPSNLPVHLRKPDGILGAAESARGAYVLARESLLSRASAGIVERVLAVFFRPDRVHLSLADLLRGRRRRGCGDGGLLGLRLGEASDAHGEGGEGEGEDGSCRCEIHFRKTLWWDVEGKSDL